MARPLIKLMRSGLWKWSTPQHQAFNKLKLALTIDLVLRLPNFERQFVVTARGVLRPKISRTGNAKNMNLR